MLDYIRFRLPPISREQQKGRTKREAILSPNVFRRRLFCRTPLYAHDMPTGHHKLRCQLLFFAGRLLRGAAI